MDDPGRSSQPNDAALRAVTAIAEPPDADVPVGSADLTGVPGDAAPTIVERTPNELNAIRDRALVGQCLEGDLEAFNRLVQLYQDYLFALVVRVVSDRESAADAVQEAFFSAYRNLARFHGDSFRSWLTRIALNAATDVLRLRKRRPADPFPEWEDDSWQPPAPESDNPERTAVRNARGRALSVALAQITEDQRRAIVLYDVEGFDYQEIADMTGVSLGTVKSRIHRGRIALREVLGDTMELFRD